MLAELTQQVDNASIRCVIEYDAFPGAYALGWSCCVIVTTGELETFIEVVPEGDDPAHWTVCDTQTCYVVRDPETGRPHNQRDIVTISTMPESTRVLSLSKLPSVLLVVQAAWEDAKALERLEEASQGD